MYTSKKHWDNNKSNNQYYIIGQLLKFCRKKFDHSNVFHSQSQVLNQTFYSRFIYDNEYFRGPVRCFTSFVNLALVVCEMEARQFQKYAHRGRAKDSADS